jgi:hypothetical protein
MIRARQRRVCSIASASISTSWRLRGISEPIERISGGSLRPGARRPGSVPGGATDKCARGTPKPVSSRVAVASLVQITARAVASAAVSLAISASRVPASSPVSSPSGWWTSATSRSRSASARASVARAPKASPSTSTSAPSGRPRKAAALAARAAASGNGKPPGSGTTTTAWPASRSASISRRA